MRKRLILLIFALVVFGTADNRSAQADMTCWPGYIVWVTGLPYCYPSGVTLDCESCLVTGHPPRSPFQPIP